jgi:hypothetical protein
VRGSVWINWFALTVNFALRSKEFPGDTYAARLLKVHLAACSIPRKVWARGDRLEGIRLVGHSEANFRNDHEPTKRSTKIRHHSREELLVLPQEEEFGL